MDYIKIRFRDDFEQQSAKSIQMIEDMFRSMNPLFTLSEKTLRPQIDIYETVKEIFLIVEIAGVDREDLEVEICRKTIKISGRRQPMMFDEKGAFRLAEI